MFHSEGWGKIARRREPPPRMWTIRTERRAFLFASERREKLARKTKIKTTSRSEEVTATDVVVASTDVCRNGLVSSEKTTSGQQPQAVVVNDEGNIQALIRTIRGVQVILDRDVSRLYGVATGALNRQVKRNEERFPADFMFRLSVEEWDNLKCQIGISSWGGDRQLPYAFTENGIAMLSSVLRSPTAIEVNIRIMRAFSAMRRFLLANAQMFQRIEAVEKRQIATDAKVDSILQRLDATEVPLQGVFYNGQLWDARALVLSLVSRAKRSLILIDNWANTEVLDLFTKKRKGVRLTIFTSEHFKKGVPKHLISPADIQTFNAQYPKLVVRYNESFHDRFLIIDDKELYLIGASLKDLGAKCFAFTKLDPADIRRVKKLAFAP